MTVSKDNPNRANPNSEKIIHRLDWPQFNHNGHWMGFGPDGKLYVSTGDGGYANDWGIGHNVTLGNGQDLKSEHGKMLRLDVDKDDGIPADNPFVGRNDAEADDLGLRSAQSVALLVRHGRHARADLRRRAAGLVRGGERHCPGRQPGLAPHGSRQVLRLRQPEAASGDLRQDRADRADHGLQELHRAAAGLPRASRSPAATSTAARNQAWQGKYIFGDWSKSFAEMDGQIFIGTKGADGKWTLEVAQIEGMKPAPYMLAFAQDERGEVYALTSISTGPVGGHDKIYRIVPAN